MTNGRTIGQFIEIKKIGKTFEEAFYKSALPDYIEKFEVDLSTARSNKPLSDVGGGEGLFKRANWYYCKVLIKGDGDYTLEFTLKNKSTVNLTQDEISKGDEISLEFIELKFTNTAQSGVTSPTFWLERRELS